MASSMTTVTLVATVDYVKGQVVIGNGTYTQIQWSVAQDTGTTKAGLGEPTGSATAGGGARKIMLLWPSANGTLPVAADTFNIVLN